MQCMLYMLYDVVQCCQHMDIHQRFWIEHVTQLITEYLISIEHTVTSLTFIVSFRFRYDFLTSFFLQCKQQTKLCQRYTVTLVTHVQSSICLMTHG